MFLLNVGGKWTLATEVEEVKGAVFLAEKNGNVRFTRKASPEGRSGRVGPPTARPSSRRAGARSSASWGSAARM